MISVERRYKQGFSQWMIHKFLLISQAMTRLQTCGIIWLTLGHFGACRFKVLVKNLYFWFPPAFKIVEYMRPAENTLKNWNILPNMAFLVWFSGFYSQVIFCMSSSWNTQVFVQQIEAFKLQGLQNKCSENFQEWDIHLNMTINTPLISMCKNEHFRWKSS
jgi:hypothetical protein